MEDPRRAVGDVERLDLQDGRHQRSHRLAGGHAEVGADDVRLLLDLGRRALGDLAPEVQHHDAVGDLHDQSHVVLDQQDGHAALVPDGPDQPGQRPDLLVVEPRRRLVEQEEPGLAGQRPGELDALERAEGEAGGRMVRHALEPEERDQLARPAPDPLLLAPHGREPEGARHEVPAGPAVHADHDVLQDREAREQGEVLERAADPERRDPVRRGVVDRAPLELERAPLRRVEPGQAVEDGRLAGAVGADQPHDLAGGHLEGDAVEGDDAAEPHREVADREDRGTAARAPGPSPPGPSPVTVSTRP